MAVAQEKVGSFALEQLDSECNMLQHKIAIDTFNSV